MKDIKLVAGESGLRHCIAVNMQTNCSIFSDSDSEPPLAWALPFIEDAGLAQINVAFPGRCGYIDSGLSGIRDTCVNSLNALRVGQIFIPTGRFTVMARWRCTASWKR
ncbi:MAG: hypothetical protein LBT65_01675 [Synergistaceae bacterium]|nr:hypothetical protein [Synergistaceae bacterium]